MVLKIFISEIPDSVFTEANVYFFLQNFLQHCFGATVARNEMAANRPLPAMSRKLAFICYGTPYFHKVIIKFHFISAPVISWCRYINKLPDALSYEVAVMLKYVIELCTIISRNNSSSENVPHNRLSVIVRDIYSPF